MLAVGEFLDDLDAHGILYVFDYFAVFVNECLADDFVFSHSPSVKG